MELRERFVELREEEGRDVPPFGVRRPRRRSDLRLAAAMVLLFIVCVLVLARRPTTFTAEDRAAAHAIAAWHPPTDSLLRMPSTGVSR